MVADDPLFNITKPKNIDSILKKPPLGIEPEIIWIEKRMWDLIECLSRHSPTNTIAEKTVTDTWLRELQHKISIVLDYDENR